MKARPMSEANPTKPTRNALGSTTPITISVVVLLLGVAFSLGAMHMQLQGLSSSLDKVLADHETRLRALERK